MPEENIPFTKEQIAELNKISSLPPEEQKKVLPNFLKKLSPEQMEFLQKQQGQQQCPFCLIAEKKIPAKKIYEDNNVMAVLDINPVTTGHTIIFPKKHFSILPQIPDVGNLFNLANKVASSLFESLGAQGTNILVANGQLAGQNIPHVIVNVIPRYKDDKVNLDLEHKQASEEELNKTLEKIKQKANFKPKEEVKPQQIKKIKSHNYEERLP